MVEKLDQDEVRSKLKEIYNEHEHKFSKINLGLDDIHCFVSDLKSLHGVTQTHRKEPNGDFVKGEYCIRISSYLTNKDDWVSTLKHELAHVAANAEKGPKADKHGRVWKKWARLLGTEPTACSVNKLDVEGKYRVGCLNGCIIKHKHRYSKTVRKPSFYQCPECGDCLASWNAGDDFPPVPGCFAEKE